MKKITIGIIIVVMTLVVPALGEEPLSPNYMGFYMSDNHVTIADSIDVEAWVDVASSIDTAAIDNMTFLPAGIIGYDDTTQGDLFGGALVWITPEGGGAIDNVSGYAYPIVWGYTTPVNNTNGTLATMGMYAMGCGMATLTITAGGTALIGIDPGTTKLPYDIYVHPQAPAVFIATAYNETQINLTWTKTPGIEKTVIRFRDDTYPTDIDDGNLLYNNTGTSCELDGLSPGDHIYFRSWGWNSTGLISLTNQSDDAITLGGNTAPNAPELYQPYNNSDYESVYNQYLRANVSDPEGDYMDIHFYWGNDSLVNIVYTVPNGTCSLSIASSLLPTWKDWLEHDTTYYWYCNATDGEFTVRSDGPFSFTTSKAWDLNEDRSVNYLDISIMVSNYLNHPTYPGQVSWDVNNDALANYLDLSLVVSHYLESY